MTDIKIFSAILLLFLCSSCSNSSDGTSVIDLFRGFINQELSELQVKDVTVIELSEYVEPRSHESIAWGKKRLILTDSYSNEVFLVTTEGDVIYKTGTKGKGPGEFESIAQLQKGPDGSLFIFDFFQKRLNEFQISHDKIKYITSFLIDIKENHNILNIYVTETGNYAVFNHTLDYRQTGEDINYLYLLDENFQPVKKILELPGYNKIQMDNGFFIQHPLPNRMLWTLENGYFYILNSHETTVSRRNLKTGETEEFRYLPEFTWINNRATTEFFLNWLEPVIKVVPNTYDAIVESETVPLNSKLLVQGDWIIIKTTYAGSNTGTLIFVNQNKGNAFYGNVPPNYIPFSMIDQSIFGIDFTDLDNVRVKRITFELTDRGTF